MLAGTVYTRRSCFTFRVVAVRHWRQIVPLAVPAGEGLLSTVASNVALRTAASHPRRNLK